MAKIIVFYRCKDKPSEKNAETRLFPLFTLSERKKAVKRKEDLSMTGFISFILQQVQYVLFKNNEFSEIKVLEYIKMALEAIGL